MRLFINQRDYDAYYVMDDSYHVHAVFPNSDHFVADDAEARKLAQEYIKNHD